MSKNIHYENNSMRKSHRISIPVKLRVENNLYDVYDWSMTGLSVSDKQKRSFTVGNTYDSVFMLAMTDATVSIKTKIVCKNEKNGRYGFEFVNLSNKNKKVLRRYLELYLDGNLASVDDIISTYREPDIKSAIVEPVKLNESEKTLVEKSFLRRTWGALLFSLLFLSLLAALLYQNFYYRYERVGTVESNYKTIYPSYEGVIDSIYPKVGDRVDNNDALVDFDTNKIHNELKILESIKESRLKERAVERSFRKNSKKTVPVEDNNLLYVNRNIVNERESELQNAQMLLNQQLITMSEYLSVKKSLQDAKAKYAFYKKQSSYQQRNTISSPPRVINVKEIELKIENQKRVLEELRIFSPLGGVVYEINANVGDRVGKKDPVMTLWTGEVPEIIVTLSAYKAVDLKIGDKVEIVDSLESKKYSGVVTNINNLSFSKNYKISTQKSENQVYVSIKPEESAKLLFPHSVVRVLFKRNFGF